MQHWWPEQLCTEIETKLSSSSYSEFPLLESLLDHRWRVHQAFHHPLFLHLSRDADSNRHCLQERSQTQIDNLYFLRRISLVVQSKWVTALTPNVNARTIARSVIHNTLKYISTKICVYIISLFKVNLQSLFKQNLNKTPIHSWLVPLASHVLSSKKTLEHHPLTLCAFHSPYKLWKFTLMLRIQLKW